MHGQRNIKIHNIRRFQIHRKHINDSVRVFCNAISFVVMNFIPEVTERQSP
jgi:hypothetical protein